MPQSQARISPVLHEKLGENGAAALAETLEAFMQQHARELEDAAWRRVEKRLDHIDDTLEKLAEAQQSTVARDEAVDAGSGCAKRRLSQKSRSRINVSCWI